MHLLTTGVGLQLATIVIYIAWAFGGLPPFNPWILIGALGLVGAILVLVGSFGAGAGRNQPSTDQTGGSQLGGNQPDGSQSGANQAAATKAHRALGVIGALFAGAGWGSWLFVGLTSDLGDPVINITGLLALPGLILCIVCLAVVASDRRRALPRP